MRGMMANMFELDIGALNTDPKAWSSPFLDAGSSLGIRLTNPASRHILSLADPPGFSPPSGGCSLLRWVFFCSLDDKGSAR